MNYYTYILFSPSRYQYYVGHSHEPPECTICQHNEGKRIITKKGIPWQLVFSKQFENCLESHLLTRKLQNVKSRKLLRYLIDYLKHKDHKLMIKT